MRVFTVSDVHVSFPANLKLLEDHISAANDKYVQDILIIAGDVCEELGRLGRILELLKKAFKHVYYCVGNHELWLTSEVDKKGSSIDKLNRILAICDEIGIDTAPTRVKPGLWICPLHSWHEPSFDETYTVGSSKDWEGVKQAGDYIYCKWPPALQQSLERGAVCEYFLQMNEEGINQVLSEKKDGDVVISFSHFLPRSDILNRKWLFNPLLPRFVGCSKLDAQVRRLGAKTHVFGHTHIDFDKEIDGVRYLQKSLGYPRERQMWKLAANDYQPFLICEV